MKYKSGYFINSFMPSEGASTLVSVNKQDPRFKGAPQKKWNSSSYLGLS